MPTKQKVNDIIQQANELDHLSPNDYIQFEEHRIRVDRKVALNDNLDKVVTLSPVKVENSYIRSTWCEVRHARALNEQFSNSYKYLYIKNKN